MDFCPEAQLCLPSQLVPWMMKSDYSEVFTSYQVWSTQVDAPNPGTTSHKPNAPNNTDKITIFCTAALGYFVHTGPAAGGNLCGGDM